MCRRILRLKEALRTTAVGITAITEKTGRTENPGTEVPGTTGNPETGRTGTKREETAENPETGRIENPGASETIGNPGTTGNPGIIGTTGENSGIIKAAGVIETIGTIGTIGTMGTIGNPETAGTIGAAEITKDMPDRETDRTAVNLRPRGAAVKMQDIRATDKTDIREMAGRALKMVRMIAGVRALARAAAVIITAVRATAAAMADREPDTEIISRAKDLWEKRLLRIWKRSVKKIREGQTARRRISVPARIISMKKRIH